MIAIEHLPVNQVSTLNNPQRVYMPFKQIKENKKYESNFDMK